MKLYGFPMSCSYAVHTALEKSGLPYDIEWVDLPSGRLADGSPYRDVNPRQQVPSLLVEGAGVLTETPAILMYLADQAPEAKLAPTGPLERARLQEALNYMSSEVHKHVLWPLANLPNLPVDQAAMRALLLDLLAVRLSYLSDRLGDKPYYLGDGFTVADSLLLVVLHWAGRHEVDLARWPNLAAYRSRLSEEPGIAGVRAINLAKCDEILAAGGRV